jgi:hypothetical protein
VGTAVTVTDSDTPNFNSGNLTVHISANGQSGQDVLGMDTSGMVSLSSGTSVGSVVTVGGVSIGVIASNGDGVGGNDLIVTFNSNATPSRVATLVAALTYNNSSNDPNTATRTVNVSVNDGRGGSSSSNVTVAVAAVNDAPLPVPRPAIPLSPWAVPQWLCSVVPVSVRLSPARASSC